YGFRPKRSPHDALQVVIDEAWRGRRWVVETDIADCFSAIPHDELIRAVEERVCDQAVLKLLRAILRAGVMEDGLVRRPVTGAAQGGVISLGMSCGPTSVKRILVRRALAPPASGLAGDARSSIVANFAAGEEQVNVDRPQRQRGRTTLTGDERRPCSATRWGHISIGIKPVKIGKWGRNWLVGGSKCSS
ncbi:MAG TPA: reverse transcriptase domain-containing protein, partial [Pyrinomonadaceae bacterium]|nr:reverse transcriptase domain-containing protein [Pyrinomonadaceae bacterium]